MTMLMGRGGIGPFVDLILVAGQSNAVGEVGAGVLPAHLAPSDSGIKTWGGSSFATLVNSTNGNALCDVTANWGLDAEFAYQYRLKYSSRTLYLCKFGVASTQLASTGDATTDWAPTSSGELFATMEAYATNARAAIASLNPRVSLLWMQGESDALNTTLASAYGANLAAFFDAVNHRWSNIQTKTVIGRISNASTWTFRAAVRTAQSAAAGGFVAVVNTDSYPLQGDNAHYTAAGYVSLGADMFTAWDGL